MVEGKYGRYKILSKIQKGGSGIIMKAMVLSYTNCKTKDEYRPKKGQTVIIKLIKKRTFRDMELEVLQ